MAKSMKTTLLWFGIAVLAGIAYLWWKNRQANSGINSPTGSLGTNLNSMAPILMGSSSGGSGLNYYQGSNYINVTLPNGQPPGYSPPHLGPPNTVPALPAHVTPAWPNFKNPDTTHGGKW